MRPGPWGVSTRSSAGVFSLRPDSVQGKTSRAVSRNGNARALGVAGVEPDQFDHQIKFIGNVDFTRHTIGPGQARRGGFAGVMQPIKRCVSWSTSGNTCIRPRTPSARTTCDWRSQTRTRHENIRTLENYFREFSFFFGYRDCYRVFYRVPADGALLTKPAELLLF